MSAAGRKPGAARLTLGRRDGSEGGATDAELFAARRCASLEGSFVARGCADEGGRDAVRRSASG